MPLTVLYRDFFEAPVVFSECMPIFFLLFFRVLTLYTTGFSHFVTSMTAPIASGWRKIAGWDSHPLRNAAFARRTPEAGIYNQWRKPPHCR